jgi:hypothetical protein
MAKRVFLVVELNVYEREGLRFAWIRWIFGMETSRQVDRYSLWMVGGDYDPAQDDHTHKGVRLAGPVSQEEARGLSTKVKRVLEEAGVEVVMEEAVDD